MVFMVKLQKHKAYTYKTESGKNIEHYKHLVVIPENILAELGWNQGAELIPIIKGQTLVLKVEEEA